MIFPKKYLIQNIWTHFLFKKYSQFFEPSKKFMYKKAIKIVGKSKLEQYELKDSFFQDFLYVFQVFDIRLF